MSTDEASLEGLTRVLTEFYCSSTKSERRIELRNTLNDFEQTPNAWFSALYFLWSSKDSHVALYCLGVVEATVLRKWSLLDEGDKQKIRSFLQTYIEQCIPKSDANFLTKKAAKVLACIACFDWPHTFPDYFTWIRSHILNNADNLNLKQTTVGLCCMQAAFEQLLNPPELVFPARKLAIQNSLIEHIPWFYDTFSTMLSSLCDQTVFSVSKTMLSAQTQWDDPGIGPQFWLPILTFSNTLVQDCLSDWGLKCYALLTFLDCLGEMLKFAFRYVDSQDCFVILFVMSLVGAPQCLSACLGAQEALALSDRECCSYLRRISLSALTYIHELAERHLSHSSNGERHTITTLKIMQCHFGLATGSIIPEQLRSSSDSVTSQHASDHDIFGTLLIDTNKQSTFQDHALKLVDILRCLVPTICRLDGPQYSIDPTHFLKLVCDFTFSWIKDLETFFACLNVWTALFESLRIHYSSNLDSNSQSPLQLPAHFHTVILGFEKTLVAQLFYSDSANFLDSLDEDILDDCETCFSPLPETIYNSEDCVRVFLSDSQELKTKSEPSEYQIFLRECFLVFHELVELSTTVPSSSASSELMNLVVQRFQSTWTDFHSGLQSAGLSSSMNNLSITTKNQPVHRIHWIFRDFATSLQLLGFLMDHISMTTTSVSGRELLQAILHSLQMMTTILPILSTIEEHLIRLDLIEVTVQLLLILHAFIIGGHVGCETQLNNSEPAPSRISLTLDEWNSFTFELLSILEKFLLPLDDATARIPFRVRVSSALLLKSLLSSPWPDIHPSETFVSVHNTETGNQNHTSVIVDSLFNAVCQTQLTGCKHFHIVRLLVSAFLCYLSTEGTRGVRPAGGNLTDQNFINQPGSKNSKHNMLTRLISEFFLPYLDLSYFQVNPDNHLIRLGYLNEALIGLENSDNNARRLIYTSLTESQLIENLMNCLLHVLNHSTPDPSVQIKFCTAYLTFFTTFIRILSYSGNIMSRIPHLFEQIIKALCATPVSCAPEGTESLSCECVEHLLNMLILISQNRKILTSLVGQLLQLCIHIFLPILTTIPGAYYKDDTAIVTSLVCNSCVHNQQLTQQFYELLFSTLSNGFSFFFAPKSYGDNNNPNLVMDLFIPVSERYSLLHPDIFHRLMMIVTAAFHTDQVNSTVVRFVLEKLAELQRLRKLYTLPDFNSTWLPEISYRLLNYLTEGKHSACRDTILETLHQLSLTFAVSSVNGSSGIHSFVRLFLPAYLTTAQNHLTDTQRAHLLSLFAKSPPSNCTSCNVGDLKLLNLEDFSVFSQSVEHLISYARFYRITNTQKDT